MTPCPRAVSFVFVFLLAASFVSAVGLNFDTPTKTEVSFFTGNLTNLSELDDTNIPNPANNEILSWHAASQRWIAKAVTSAFAWTISTANGYLYNDSTTIYFNNTKLNDTINEITGDGYVPYTGADKNVVLGNNNFSVGGTDLFVDGDKGRVGIGTNSPAQKLDIDTGNVMIDNAYFYALGGSTNNGLTREGFFGSNGMGLQNFGGDISLMTNGQDFHYIGAWGGSPVFTISAGGDVNVTDDLFVADSVGIGTDSPTSLTTISKTINGFDNQGHLEIKNSFNTINSTYAGIGFNARNTLQPKAWFGFDQTGSSARGDFIWLLDNSGVDSGVDLTNEVMRITNDGNVGIGTDSPAVKLDVLGTGLISAGSANATLIANQISGTGRLLLSSSNPRLLWEDTDAAASEKVFVADYSTGSLTFKSIDDTGGSNVKDNILVLDGATGNVGIGTDSPGQALTIDGNLWFVGDKEIKANGGDLKIYSSDDLLIGTDGSSSIQIGRALNDIPVQFFSGTAEGEVMRVFNGNVGIGTATPQSKLDVVGDINVSDDLFVADTVCIGCESASEKLHVSNTGGDVALFEGQFGNTLFRGHVLEFSRAGANYFQASSSGGDFLWAVNGSDLADSSMIFTSDSLLGINTTTPQNTLNVVGDTNSTGTGFFGYIGSTIARITKGWFTELDVSGNITANALDIGSASFVNLSKHSNIDGAVVGMLMTNPPNIEAPHFWLQSGGPGQASGIARSFMIVNENATILNSENRSDCQTWADHYGTDLLIDCNTTTTGADLFVGDDAQIVGDMYANNVIINGSFSAKRAYGMFSSNESQVTIDADVAYPMNFSHVEDTYLVELINNENITVNDSGDYLIELSVIIITDSNNKHFSVWPQINGVNVPRSTTRLEIENSGTEQVIAVPFILDLEAGDNFRIMFLSDDAGSSTVWTAGYGSGANAVPETPSIILTMTKISETTD